MIPLRETTTTWSCQDLPRELLLPARDAWD